MHAEKILT